MRVSVKQIQRAHACPRQWAYHFLERVPEIKGPALVQGNELHVQMKALLTGETPPFGPESPIGKMARELMVYAEPRSVNAVSEIVRLVPLPEWGVKVELRCDFMDITPPGGGRPIFKDWKTTGAERPTSKLQDGRLWALNDLTNDFQANIYAFLLMHEHWKVPEVDAQWCFASKKFKAGKTPRTWSVEKHFTYAEARSWWERYCVPIIELIREMRASWAEKQLDSARLVPHNPDSCEHTGHFCDAAGLCRFVSSPIGDYSSLHLPVLPQKRT